MTGSSSAKQQQCARLVLKKSPPPAPSVFVRGCAECERFHLSSGCLLNPLRSMRPVLMLIEASEANDDRSRGRCVPQLKPGRCVIDRHWLQKHAHNEQTHTFIHIRGCAWSCWISSIHPLPLTNALITPSPNDGQRKACAGQRQQQPSTGRGDGVQAAVGPPAAAAAAAQDALARPPEAALAARGQRRPAHRAAQAVRVLSDKRQEACLVCRSQGRNGNDEDETRSVYVEKGWGQRPGNVLNPALLPASMRWKSFDLHVILTPPLTTHASTRDRHRSSKQPTPRRKTHTHAQRHRIAWAGGKIKSNKEEALIQFLRRKQGNSCCCCSCAHDTSALCFLPLLTPPNINTHTHPLLWSSPGRARLHALPARLAAKDRSRRRGGVQGHCANGGWRGEGGQ